MTLFLFSVTFRVSHSGVAEGSDLQGCDRVLLSEGGLDVSERCCVLIFKVQGVRTD